MSLPAEIDLLCGELVEEFPLYQFATCIRRGKPRFWRSTYSEAYLENYWSQNRLLVDPSIFWAMAVKDGARRWSAITIPDPVGIFEQCSFYGLEYGAIISIGPAECKSLGSIARSDREFTRDEIDIAAEIFADIHCAALKPGDNPSKTHLEALDLYAQGLSYDEIWRSGSTFPVRR